MVVVLKERKSSWDVERRIYGRCEVVCGAASLNAFVVGTGHLPCCFGIAWNWSALRGMIGKRECVWKRLFTLYLGSCLIDFTESHRRHSTFSLEAMNGSASCLVSCQSQGQTHRGRSNQALVFLGAVTSSSRHTQSTLTSRRTSFHHETKARRQAFV